MRELWSVCCTAGFTMLTGLVLTAAAVGIIRWPEDPPKRPPPDRHLELLREELEAARGELARERAGRMAALVELDAIRRGAVWLPRKDDERERAGELIPAQALPVGPGPVVPAIPAAQE